MAINPQDLHNLLSQKLKEYSESDAYQQDKEHPAHMNLMAELMQNYFEENTKITYGWSASNPASGVPDPVVSFQSTVRFSPWDLSSPLNLAGLAAKIMAATATGILRHPADFSLPPGTYQILPLILPQHSDPSRCLMECIVKPVCTWMKTLVNPIPLAGTHGAFTGATAGMVIT